MATASTAPAATCTDTEPPAVSAKTAKTKATAKAKAKAKAKKSGSEEKKSFDKEALKAATKTKTTYQAVVVQLTQTLSSMDNNASWAYAKNGVDRDNIKASADKLDATVKSLDEFSQDFLIYQTAELKRMHLGEMNSDLMACNSLLSQFSGALDADIDVLRQAIKRAQDKHMIEIRK